MKKRAFLLLEILLAFALVTICAIPLVKQPLHLYKKEMESLWDMELGRLADWTFTEIKEILLKNEIPWKKIPTKGMTSSPFPLPPVTLRISGCSPKEIQRSFTLHTHGEKMGPQNETYRQIWVHVFLNQKKYHFRVPIKRVAVEE